MRSSICPILFAVLLALEFLYLFIPFKMEGDAETVALVCVFVAEVGLWPYTLNHIVKIPSCVELLLGFAVIALLNFLWLGKIENYLFNHNWFVKYKVYAIVDSVDSDGAYVKYFNENLKKESLYLDIDDCSPGDSLLLVLNATYEYSRAKIHLMDLAKYKYPVKYYKNTEIGSPTHYYAKYNMTAFCKNYGLDVVHLATWKDNCYAYSPFGSWLRTKGSDHCTEIGHAWVTYNVLNPSNTRLHFGNLDSVTVNTFKQLPYGSYGYFFNHKIYTAEEFEKMYPEARLYVLKVKQSLKPNSYKKHL